MYTISVVAKLGFYIFVYFHLLSYAILGYVY